MSTWKFWCLGTLALLGLGCGHKAVEEREADLAMRMIGHRVLLQAGDSTSRVLPVVREEDRFRIAFESEFSFAAGSLVKTVEGVMEETGLARAYLVEIQSCGSDEVAYSFKVGGEKSADVIPCGPRPQPRDCYFLWVSLLDQNGIGSGIWLGAASLLAMALLWLGLRSRKASSVHGNDSGSTAGQLKVGRFTFDRQAPGLELDGQWEELTFKESALLEIMLAEVGRTVDREQLLKEVWGDNGSYVGRTLDVYISRLRKKLAADPQVRIANERGVGYRLQIGEDAPD